MKRRGFTLIELMVVIAIIIILAAIAIPNYLKMTERAKKSRLASDMATLATGLETFKTDWGKYPTTNATASGITWAAITTGTIPFDELGGTGNTKTINIAGATNAVGESGPVEYLKVGTLKSIVDPFKASSPTDADGFVHYSSDGNKWVLYAYTGTSTTEVYLFRTDSNSSVSATAAAPTTY